MFRENKCEVIFLLFCVSILLLCGCQTTTSFTEEDLIGTWEWYDQAFVQFNEDGSFKLVDEGNLSDLDTVPSDYGQYKMEGMELTIISSDDSPLCPGVSGIYTVEQEEGLTIRLMAKEDTCVLYSGDFLVFNRVNFFKNTPLSKMTP